MPTQQTPSQNQKVALWERADSESSGCHKVRHGTCSRTCSRTCSPKQPVQVRRVWRHAVKSQWPQENNSLQFIAPICLHPRPDIQTRRAATGLQRDMCLPWTVGPAQHLQQHTQPKTAKSKSTGCWHSVDPGHVLGPDRSCGQKTMHCNSLRQPHPPAAMDNNSSQSSDSNQILLETATLHGRVQRSNWPALAARKPLPAGL